MRLEVKEIFERVMALILFEENFLGRIFVPKWQKFVKKKGWTVEHYLINRTNVACAIGASVNTLFIFHIFEFKSF